MSRQSSNSVKSAQTVNNNNQVGTTAMSIDYSSNSIIEIRGTLKPNKSDNQIQFFFHNGRITARNDGSGMFGEFRPIKIEQKNEGGVNSPKVNDEGDFVTSKIWAARISKPNFNLTVEEATMVQAIKLNPTIATLVPVAPHVLEAAKSTDLNYTPFEWSTFLTRLIGHEQAKFVFSIPQQFISTIESIKDTLESKEDGQNYSFVMQFDANQIRFGADLKEEYQSELLRKDLKIIPIYIGVIDGITRSENETKNLINPIDISSALDAATQTYETNKDKNQYISKEYLAVQANRVLERLGKIGTGKKAHQSLVDEIFNTPKESAEFSEAVAVLRAIEERGENKAVPTGYTDKILSKVETESPKTATVSSPVKEEVVVKEIVEEVKTEEEIIDEEPQSIALSANDLDSLLFD